MPQSISNSNFTPISANPKCSNFKQLFPPERNNLVVLESVDQDQTRRSKQSDFDLHLFVAEFEKPKIGTSGKSLTP